MRTISSSILHSKKPQEVETQGKIEVEITMEDNKTSNQRGVAISKTPEEVAEAHNRIEEPTNREIITISLRNHIHQPKFIHHKEKVEAEEEGRLFNNNYSMHRNFTLSKEPLNHMEEARIIINTLKITRKVCSKATSSILIITSSRYRLLPHI